MPENRYASAALLFIGITTLGSSISELSSFVGISAIASFYQALAGFFSLLAIICAFMVSILLPYAFAVFISIYAVVAKTKDNSMQQHLAIIAFILLSFVAALGGAVLLLGNSSTAIMFQTQNFIAISGIILSPFAPYFKEIILKRNFSVDGVISAFREMSEFQDLQIFYFLAGLLVLSIFYVILWGFGLHSVQLGYSQIEGDKTAIFPFLGAYLFARGATGFFHIDYKKWLSKTAFRRK